MNKNEALNSQQNIRDIILSTALFRSLFGPQQEQLFKKAKVLHINNGQILFQHGDRLPHIYLILKGSVKTFCSDSSGNEKIIQLLKENDLSFETAVFMDIPSPVSAQAVSDCQVLTIPSSLIRSFIHENAAFSSQIIEYISHNFQVLITQIEGISLKTPYERVAYYLLHKFIDLGSTHKEFSLPHKKSLLANKLGMTPETFSRALRELRNHGIFVEKNIVRISHQSAFCQFCDSVQAAKCPRHDNAKCPYVEPKTAS